MLDIYYTNTVPGLKLFSSNMTSLCPWQKERVQLITPATLEIYENLKIRLNTFMVL